MQNLKSKNTWVLWKKEIVDSRTSKVPYSTDGNRCGTNSKYESKWKDYETAKAALEGCDYAGLGFVIPKGLVMIDLDSINPTDPFVKEIIGLTNSYAEVSPSGNGIHVIAYVDMDKVPQVGGKLDSTYYCKNPHNDMEIYFGGLTNRYATFTGDSINDLPIADITDKLMELLDTYMKKSNFDSIDEALDDFDIIATARRAKNGEKFISLFDEGDSSNYGSHSEADQALSNILAFYTGGNKEQMDRLFRLSKLYRDKWDRDDYREATIDKAIKGCEGNFYLNGRGLPPYLYFTPRTNQLREYDTDILTMRDVNEVFSLLSTDLEFVSSKMLNTDEGIINFKNGLLRLDDMKLIPHSPEVLSTIQLPSEWNHNPNSTPVFDSFMDKLTDGDREVENLLLEFMGACISNVNGHRMKKSLFMVGPGDTGKSQLKRLMELILGNGNYVGIDLKEIEARFGTANIFNKRLAGSSYMSFVTIGELKTFKKATGGDSIFAEFKGKDGFEFVYGGLFWFCMNRLPKFGGDDGKWVYERIMLVKCENVIPPGDQDKCLLDKLYMEREGIIHKCVLALKNIIENGYVFTEPDSVVNFRNQYRYDNSTVISFFIECLEERPGGKIKDGCTTGKVYDVYKAWCVNNNHGYAKTAKEFREEVSDYLATPYPKLITRRGKGGSFFKKFTLTDEAKETYFKAYGYDSYEFLKDAK